MHAVRRPAQLLSGIAVCLKCGRGLHYRNYKGRRVQSYACISGPKGCGGTAIKADMLEEYVTGAVLDALDSLAMRREREMGIPRRRVEFDWRI